ncbi:hypothetical protein EMMF5_000603 [Cystobasidiomycetes sp. EMM_F5]
MDASGNILTDSLRWIGADLYSLAPSYGFADKVKPLAVGDDAPTTPISLKKGSPSILLFTRHLGCPYCELEIRQIVKEAQKPKNENTTFYIVIHSVQTQVVESFLQNELGVPIPANVVCYGDEERLAYAEWGLGEIGLYAIFKPEVLAGVWNMRKDGIKNRYTRGTRWQTNGGFAVDADNKVRYIHIGKDSSDVTNLRKAMASIR